MIGHSVYEKRRGDWSKLGLLVVVTACLPAGAGGCSGKDANTRYPLSGKATWGGNPIPAGIVAFAPDSALGNQGPGGMAEIRDGAYETRAEQGVVGGAYVVTIRGYEQGMSAPLFAPYEMKISLDEKVATYDLDVPAKVPKLKFKQNSEP